MSDHGDPLGPARGCMYGLLFGSLMWVVIVVVIISLSKGGLLCLVTTDQFANHA